ncbi:13043_t:CDS:2 [Acaulospora colombiana]|uniref:13043_t:CDS:1 n=1 Tax=Acaulospora colombiana TaxID=27376 RepID=A0ACA9LD61_9GLOM|nr:13043_t:CDS:2 [Acaulospora colombiana]
MTRSILALDVTKTRTSRRSSKSSITSSTSNPPSIPTSPTTKSSGAVNKSDRNPRSPSIDYELNDALRSLVDELCDIFVDARQRGMNEAQTVELLHNYFKLQNQDPSQIFEWLQNNTHKNEYTTILGYFYDQGIANARNQRKAYCLYLSAAKKGYNLAQDLLGDCYYSGQGTTRDRDMAFEWYHKAADNGCTGSQFSLGICYAVGQNDTYHISRIYKVSKQANDHDGVVANTKFQYPEVGNREGRDNEFHNEEGIWNNAARRKEENPHGDSIEKEDWKDYSEGVMVNIW